jgi:hypothetical protein
MVQVLTRYDHDFGYGLWHRLARDPAEAVRFAATDYLRHLLPDGHIEPESQESFDFTSVTPQEALALIQVSEQVARHEIPPFDLGQETLAIALGHMALPDWLQPGQPSA